jgi:hypothetical protein
MNTKLYIGLLASSLLVVAGVAGCGSDTTGTGGGGTSATGATSATSSGSSTSTGVGSTTTSTGTGMTTPPAPVLGKQIDRFGRPAINTALNHSFDKDPMAAGKAKDAYNAEADASMWATLAAPQFAGNLAILDGLDTKCGNQIAAGPTPTAGRYAALAGVLADDRVWLNTAATACTTYLAVEADFLGNANMDCGGRKLDYDVIDASYTALATGGAGAVGDGVAADADTKGATFPYLAGPH